MGSGDDVNMGMPLKRFGVDRHFDLSGSVKNRLVPNARLPETAESSGQIGKLFSERIVVARQRESNEFEVVLLDAPRKLSEQGFRSSLGKQRPAGWAKTMAAVVTTKRVRISEFGVSEPNVRAAIDSSTPCRFLCFDVLKGKQMSVAMVFTTFEKPSLTPSVNVRVLDG